MTYNIGDKINTTDGEASGTEPKYIDRRERGTNDSIQFTVKETGSSA